MGKRGPHRFISCTVCQQPMPPQCDNDYFSSAAAGYQPDEEWRRAVADIGLMLIHLNTVNCAIGDAFALRGGGTARPQELFDKAVWHLCYLFSDLLREATRRFTQLDAWVSARWPCDQEE